jgi:SAM-dependent methyltransferase
MLDDAWFEFTTPVDTVRGRSPMASEGAHRQFPPEPTRVRAFRQLMRTLDLPAGGAFVDFGCGAGRVLLLASELGFARVTGVELVPELCARAQRNLDRYARRRGGRAAGDGARPQVEVVQSDAVAYGVRDDDAVFYLFHPFNGRVLREVVANVGRSLARRPRPAWLIYNNPRHEEVVGASGVFARQRTFVYGSSEFAVYASAPNAGAAGEAAVARA